MSGSTSSSSARSLTCTRPSSGTSRSTATTAEGWFLAFRCFTKYVQLQFFRGTSLDPVPPKASKHDEVRYLDIHEGDDLDESLLVSWIEQASNLPGEKV